ncbi:MAG: outer membrane protein assembly factor BamD [Verrucomicrobiota bacterium]
MGKLIPILFLVAALTGLFSQRSQAALVYRAGDGWSSESEDEGAVESTASAQLRKAQELENSGDIKGALGAYRGLVRKYPTSGVAAKSQLKVGELYEKTGDYEKAFDAYGKYLTVYPKGEDFDQAVAAQFNIAKRFLEGERKRMFGVKTFPSMERASKMFEEIVKNAPYSKYAPMAQFNLGQSYEKQQKYAEAVAAYQVVTQKYPADSLAVDAQYQVGYVYLRESRDSNDPAARAKARDAFEDFIARYPNSEKVSQAKDDLKSLSGNETKSVLGVAKFYDRQKNYKAAVIYYNEVIKQQPGTPDSDYAKNRIEELKSLVGEDALHPGPERTETGERARLNRKLQAKVDTTARPDYVGPPVVVPDEVAPKKPKVRTAPGDTGPVPAVEPALPQ